VGPAHRGGPGPSARRSKSTPPVVAPQPDSFRSLHRSLGPANPNVSGPKHPLTAGLQNRNARFDSWVPRSALQRRIPHCKAGFGHRLVLRLCRWRGAGNRCSRASTFPRLSRACAMMGAMAEHSDPRTRAGEKLVTTLPSLRAMTCESKHRMAARHVRALRDLGPRTPVAFTRQRRACKSPQRGRLQNRNARFDSWIQRSAIASGFRLG
jgi:hypothetical protein